MFLADERGLTMHTFAQKPKATQQTTPAKSTMPGRHFGQSPEVRSILHLQRTIGNQALQRMLRTDAEEPEADLTRPASLRFGHVFSRIPIHPPAAGAIQAKLAINRPGDAYEQEADRIADEVMAAAAHPVGRDAPPRIQRFRAQSIGQVGTAPASVDQALARPGRPLEPALRQDMEQRFGYDFSQVRVHSGSAAAESAREVNARAYTVGPNIVFRAGQLTPGTHEGRRLIAHELTHVMQQSGAVGMSVAVQRAPMTEAEALRALAEAERALQREMGGCAGLYRKKGGQAWKAAWSTVRRPPTAWCPTSAVQRLAQQASYRDCRGWGSGGADGDGRPR